MTLRIHFTLLIYLCCTTTYLAAQEAIKIADLNYSTLKFYDVAATYYEKALSGVIENATARANLADCYYYMNEPEKATKEFERAFKAENNLDAKFMLHYARSLQMLAKYDDAQVWLARYAKYNAAAKKILQQSADYKNIKNSQFTVRLEPVNSNMVDFSPAIFDDKQLLFVSSRRTAAIQVLKVKNKNNKTNKEEEQTITQVFSSIRKADNALELATTLRGDLTVFDQAGLSFNADRSLLAYCRFNFRNGLRHLSDTDMKADIETAKVKTVSNWVDKTSFPNNNTDNFVGFPALSPDGNKMYFVSNRAGGFGGLDLYVCELEGNKWSLPLNLGAKINTPGDETTPFFDGKNLYFSSDWHVGLGGFDIFKINLSDKTYTAENLGKGVNSTYDDLYFTMDKKGNAYFSSNRKGGVGDLDIYSATPIAAKTVVEKTKTEDKKKDLAPQNTTSGSKIYVGQILNAGNDNSLDNVSVKVVNVKSGKTLTSKTDTNGEFAVLLDTNTAYTIEYSIQGFLGGVKSFTTTADNPKLGKFKLAPAAATAVKKSDPPKNDPKVTTKVDTIKTLPQEKPKTRKDKTTLALPQSDKDNQPEATVAERAIFKIQLGALKSSGRNAFDDLKSLGEIEETAAANGTVYYFLGNFENLEKAKTTQKKVAVQGFKDAFIVAYKNGQRIGLAEAIEQ